MKINEINSQLFKIITMDYFRHNRQFELVATEYRLRVLKKLFYADVIALNDKEFIELEIKINKKDLYIENDTKKLKHSFYKNGQQNIDKNYFIPNRFYFVLTEDMCRDREVISYINSLNKNYGIIKIRIWDDKLVSIDIIKNGKLLHKNKPSKNLIEKINKKISAENISLRKKLYELGNKKAT